MKKRKRRKERERVKRDSLREREQFSLFTINNAINKVYILAYKLPFNNVFKKKKLKKVSHNVLS